MKTISYNKTIIQSICLLFIIFLNFSIIRSQSPTEKKEWFENGEFFYNSEDYQEAVYYYLRLHDADPQNGNLNYHIGDCYLNIPGQEIKSIPYLEQAVSKITPKLTYQNFKSTLQQTQAPLHTYFYLAKAYRMNNQMDKALEMLDKFSSSVYFEGNYNEALVNAEFDACKKAQIIMERPIMVNITNIGNTINNTNDNYDPVLSPDTTVIIYMNNLKFYNAIFMSRQINGKWDEPENITPLVGSDGDSYPTCLSSDGKNLFLVKRIKKNSDIYVSHYENGKWNLMEPLNENINTKWNETHASITADGKRLYFASDRKGTLGGMDIWYSDLEPDGQWGKAVNLGPSINTRLDEDNPYETADGTTLFFSSQGHLNMGGFDIFYSKKDGQQWSNAVNLGFPVNTTLDDKFYYPIGNGTIGYMARRMAGGFGLQDIYRVQITGGDAFKDLKSILMKEEFASSGNEKVTETKDTVKAKITPASEPKIKPQIDTIKQLTKTPAAIQELQKKKIETKEKSDTSKHISIIPVTIKEESKKSFHVTAILFGFNSFQLTSIAKRQLDILANAMARYSDIEIEIHGHTDATGSEYANMAISRKRAEFVARYLSGKGIREQRLKPIAFGKSNPIAINKYADGKDNPEGRKYNRRVEFKIISRENPFFIIEKIKLPDSLKFK